MRIRLVRPMALKSSPNPQFVKRIPADLLGRMVGRKLAIPLAGETVIFEVTGSTQSIRFSLKTSDPLEAKLRHAEAVSYVEQVFEALRTNRPIDLTHRQITALAGEFYRSWASGPDAIRSLSFTVSTGQVSAEDDEFDAEMLSGAAESLREKFEQAGDDELTKNHSPDIDRMLSRHGIPQVTQSSRIKLARAFSRMLLDGLDISARRASGDYSADPNLSKFPSWEPSPALHPPPTPNSNLSLIGLVDAWWKEAEAVGKSLSTYESYSNTVRQFSAFIGHDDAMRVSPEDVIRYKNHRLSMISPRTGKPISPITIKGSDLTAFKSVFDWAVSNRMLPSNPASGVTVKLGKKTKTRERDFTEDEAVALLTAAAGALVGVVTPNQTQLAERWVPWLCAYSGARVGELLQLRKQDFRRDEGTKAWIMTITPEAGTVKGKEAREVPLHPHLIDMGFMDFVKAAKQQYLFMTIKPNATFRGVWRSKKNRLAEFARKHIKDPNVAPNHGWRHTFKMKGFEAGIQEKVLDAICGHAPSSVGRAYGSVSVKTKVDAMALFPRFKA